MPLPTSIHAYNDVRAVLDAAVANDGGRYSLPSEGQAVHWRQRAYKLRKLIWESGRASPYDDFELTLDGPTVIIRRKAIENLTDLSGNPITPAEPEDELIDEAAALRRKLDLDLE